MFAILLMANSNSTLANNTNMQWNGKGSIEAEGYGYPPNNAIGGQARILARRAAMVDAYRILAETISGVSIDASTTVANLQVESDIIKTKVTAVIKNARIVEEKFNSDGAYKVVMQLPLFGENSLASAVMPTNQTLTAFPDATLPQTTTQGAQQATQTTTTIQTPPQAANTPIPAGVYTGVIIDCFGLSEINPVMSPVILNENREPIYGHQFLDSAFVVQNGMADYVTRSGVDASRAGASPLVLKAIALEKHNSAPVLSQADANLLLNVNKNQNFLSRTAVVFKQVGA